MIAAAGIVLAALATVRLPVAGGAQETFFLPFDAVSADTSTLSLKTADGRAVACSLDDRLGFPRDGRYRPPADGYHSIESAPARERRFRRLGWLSFRAPTGVRELTLSFATSPGKAVARPNPAVRTWWVSLFEPSAFAKRPAEIAGAWILPADAMPPPERLAGRRFLADVVTTAVRGRAPDHSVFSVRLPNACRSHANLVQLGFVSGAAPVESLADAVVATEPVGFTNVRRPLEFVSCYSADAKQRVERPLRLDDLLLQAPPSNRPSSALRPPSDLYDVGENVRVPYPDLSAEYLADFRSPALAGVRVRPPADPKDVAMALSLKDAKGNVVRKAKDNVLSLAGVRPGRYALLAVLRVGAEEVARAQTPLEVQPPVDWSDL